MTTVIVPIFGTGYAATLYWQHGISVTDLCLGIGMYLVTVLGIELGYHRYLTHRSMKATRTMKVLMTVAGCMAADGPPIWWVAIHRRHHAYGDRDGDPHSPNLDGDSLWQRVTGHWHSHMQ